MQHMVMRFQQLRGTIQQTPHDRLRTATQEAYMEYDAHQKVVMALYNQLANAKKVLRDLMSSSVSPEFADAWFATKARPAVGSVMSSSTST